MGWNDWSYSKKYASIGGIMALALYLVAMLIIPTVSKFKFSFGDSLNSWLVFIGVSIVFFLIFIIYGLWIGSLADYGINKRKQEVQLNKQGSKVAFLFVLIGGILSVLNGSILLFDFSVNLGVVEKSIGNITALLSIHGFFSALLLIIFGVILIISAFYMEREKTLKKASIIVLIISILSLVNIFALIGALLGLFKK